MKNCFVAYKRFKDKKGIVDVSDGVIYLEPHDHVALAGKEFTSPGEAIQAVRDHVLINRDAIKLSLAADLIKAGKNDEAIALIGSSESPQKVEMVMLNIIEF